MFLDTDSEYIVAICPGGRISCCQDTALFFLFTDAFGMGMIAHEVKGDLLLEQDIGRQRSERTGSETIETKKSLSYGDGKS
jgi:hypothetical protein